MWTVERDPTKSFYQTLVLEQMFEHERKNNLKYEMLRNVKKMGELLVTPKILSYLVTRTTLKLQLLRAPYYK